jgi:hypothetical protein
MRVARPVAVTVLGLLAAACGGGAPTAHASPSPGSTTAAARTATGQSASTSAGAGATTASPSAPATAPAGARAVPTAPPAPASAISPAARRAAPTPVPGPCAATDVALSTTTDMAHYATGQNVQVSVAVRNQSAHGCVFGTPGDFSIDADPSGPSVFAVHLDCPPDGCPPLAPGQMSTYPISWNQVANEGPQNGNPVTPGSYHARATFSGYPVATSASFTIG